MEETDTKKKTEPNIELPKEVKLPIRKRPKFVSSVKKFEEKLDPHTPNRYPKRSGRKNYKEDEVPDDDHYLCMLLLINLLLLIACLSGLE